MKTVDMITVLQFLNHTFPDHAVQHIHLVPNTTCYTFSLGGFRTATIDGASLQIYGMNTLWVDYLQRKYTVNPSDN